MLSYNAFANLISSLDDVECCNQKLSAIVINGEVYVFLKYPKVVTISDLQRFYHEF